MGTALDEEHILRYMTIPKYATSRKLVSLN